MPEATQARSRTGERDWGKLALVIYLSCFLCVSGVLSWVSATRLADRSIGVWFGPCAVFLMLTVFWTGLRPQLTRGLLGAAAAVVVVPFAIKAGLGLDVLTALRTSVGDFAQGVIGLVTYRWLRSLFSADPNTGAPLAPVAQQPQMTWHQQWTADWMPQRPRDLVALLIAATVGVLATTWWGSLFSVRAGVSVTTTYAVGAVNNLGTVFVGVACVTLLARAPGLSIRARQWPLLAVALLGTTATALISAGGSNLPMSWLVLFPSLFAGLVLRPWAAAAHSMAMAVIAVSFGQTPTYVEAWTDSVPIELVLQSLLFACVMLALTLSLVQEQSRILLRELRSERVEALEQAELMSTVLGDMGDGVIVTSRSGDIAYFNDAAERILRVDLKSWDARHWPETLTVGTPEGKSIRDLATILKALNSRPTSLDLHQDVASSIARDDEETVLRLEDSDRGGVWTIGVQRALMKTGDRDQFVVLLRDLTAQLEREAALRSFAAVAAHDLRGPLTSMSGWISVALEEVDPTSDMAGLLARAVAGSERLRTIIDDWLQFSVARDGKIVPEVVSLATLVGDVVSGLDMPSVRGGAPSIEVDTPHLVVADPAMVRQLVSNLLGNSLKYRRDGVPPHVLVRSTLTDAGWVRVEVVDNGIGIRVGEEETIFNAFSRSEGVHGKFEGSGLGLSLCRDIVVRHGGEISAKRNEEHGSTFTFTLPAPWKP